MRKLLFILQVTAVVLLTIVYATAVMLAMLIMGKKIFYKFARNWSRLLLFVCGVKIHTEGLEQYADGVSRVYVSNHQSLFDIPVLLASLPCEADIMYKRELEKIPFLGWCLRLSPFIAITREDPRNAMESIEIAAESIRKGGSVIIFPEGTRSENGVLGEFRRGAVSIALRSGKPIAPIAIMGTHLILPKKALKFNTGIVSLFASKQLNPPDNCDRLVEKSLTREIHSVISSLLNQHC